jgi:hypothetical protein
MKSQLLLQVVFLNIGRKKHALSLLFVNLLPFSGWNFVRSAK